jgi:hypothetical protein
MANGKEFEDGMRVFKKANFVLNFVYSGNRIAKKGNILSNVPYYHYSVTLGLLPLGLTLTFW